MRHENKEDPGWSWEGRDEKDRGVVWLWLWLWLCCYAGCGCGYGNGYACGCGCWWLVLGWFWGFILPGLCCLDSNGLRGGEKHAGKFGLPTKDVPTTKGNLKAKPKETNPTWFFLDRLAQVFRCMGSQFFVPWFPYQFSPRTVGGCQECHRDVGWNFTRCSCLGLTGSFFFFFSRISWKLHFPEKWHLEPEKKMMFRKPKSGLVLSFYF